MPHVVTGNCERCRFTQCVTVCPVACFHGDADMLYIDPDECIDCGACLPVCPVKAIHVVADLPPDLAEWVGINARRAPASPLVDERQAPHADAELRRKALGY